MAGAEVTARPVRQTYVHARGCGRVTSMSHGLAVIFARDPGSRATIYCAGCFEIRPVNEFLWRGTEATVGS